MRDSTKESVTVCFSIAVSAVVQNYYRRNNSSRFFSATCGATYGAVAGLVFIAFSRWLHSEQAQENQSLRKEKANCEGMLHLTQEQLEEARLETKKIYESNKQLCEEKDKLMQKNAELGRYLGEATRASAAQREASSAFQSRKK